jgi:hypothetical protein
MPGQGGTASCGRSPSAAVIAARAIRAAARRTAWRWLRFRCGNCRSRDVLVRAGPATRLQEAPLPLWRREDLLEIIAEAVFTYFHYIGGDVVPISRERATTVAEVILRRLMAAGVQISEPEPEPPPRPAA